MPRRADPMRHAAAGRRKQDPPFPAIDPSLAPDESLDRESIDQPYGPRRGEVENAGQGADGRSAQERRHRAERAGGLTAVARHPVERSPEAVRECHGKGSQEVPRPGAGVSGGAVASAHEARSVQRPRKRIHTRSLDTTPVTRPEGRSRKAVSVYGGFR